MDENKNNGTQQNGQDPQTVPVPEAEENRMPDQAEIKAKTAFQLDEIDFDKAYEELKKESLLPDMETKDKIQKFREETKREEKEFKRIRRKNKTRWLRVLIFIVCILGISAAISLTVLEGFRDIMGMNKEEGKTISIEIPRDSTADEIADQLGEEGVISYPWLFKLVIKLDGTGSTLQAGLHDIPQHASYAEIVQILQQIPPEDSSVVEIQITEGDNLYEIAQKLEQGGVCNAASFISVANGTPFGFAFEDEITDNSERFYRMEGYFFPDRYKFYVDDDPADVAEKIFRNFEEKIESYRAEIEQSGKSLEEIIIMASLIQAEAANEEEMPTIASVFYNRLNNPSQYPHLQTDPTVLYVEEVIKPNIDAPNQQMYDAYNTNVCEGLPAGPICNPGEAAIKAALNPESTGYYYFVHNTETGETLFASTYEQHQANCAKFGITA